MSDAKKQWFVIEAYEGCDADAYLRLAVAGLKVWRPVDTFRAASRRGKLRPSEPRLPRRDRRVPRFGRYLFVKCTLTESLFHAIAHTPSVKGFLCASGSDSPCPVTEEQIQFYRDYRPPKPSDWHDYRVGDRMEVTSGPFLGMTCTIRALDKRGVVEVELQAFGGPTRTILEVGHVKLIAQAKSPKGKTFRSAADQMRLARTA